MGAAVILGGTGFIGTHLTQHLLETRPEQPICLVDVAEPRNEVYSRELQRGLAAGRVRFVKHDIRTPLPDDLCQEEVDVIYNLAAIHREPGHEIPEYFETNLLGAEMACDWAAKRRCKRMVFTSSISPYGPSDAVKNEFSIPTPETAYGSSKLAAEKIHLGWQAAEPDRRLVILRPGVVFGAGEGGNVSRLVRSVVRGYFLFMGNRQTRKAAGYVKELCRVMDFSLSAAESQRGKYLLLNFSFDPAPTVEQFVKAIRNVAKIRRPIPSVPRGLLLAASYPVAAVSQLLGIRQPINPVRVRKLFRSTNIEPTVLRQLGYRYSYTLESAFADWKADAPGDFE